MAQLRTYGETFKRPATCGICGRMELFTGEVEVDECVVDAKLWARGDAGTTRRVVVARCVDRVACRRTLDERRVDWPVVTELSEPSADPWAAFAPGETDEWEAF